METFFDLVFFFKKEKKIRKESGCVYVHSFVFENRKQVKMQMPSLRTCKQCYQETMIATIEPLCTPCRRYNHMTLCAFCHRLPISPGECYCGICSIWFSVFMQQQLVREIPSGLFCAQCKKIPIQSNQRYCVQCSSKGIVKKCIRCNTITVTTGHTFCESCYKQRPQCASGCGKKVWGLEQPGKKAWKRYCDRCLRIMRHEERPDRECASCQTRIKTSGDVERAFCIECRCRAKWCEHQRSDINTFYCEICLQDSKSCDVANCTRRTPRQYDFCWQCYASCQNA